MSWRFRATGILLISIVATRAEAIPAFARKYGMSCSACHVAWPILNQQGLVFRDNGYQLGLMKDEPSASPAAYVPLSLRTVPAYQLSRTTNQPGAWGKTDVQGGGIAVPAVDVLAAGTFGTDVSYLAVLAGFTPDEPGAVESAWVRLSNVGGSRWVNLRVGKFEPEQPVSERRGIIRTVGHAVYGAHFDGSAVGFDLAENHVGVELEGHDERSLTRYSLSLLHASGDPGSRGPWSSPVVYAHATRAFELDSDVMPWVRVGALGALGWWPTRFGTEGSPTGPRIPNSGRDFRKYARVGAEVSGIFGSPATPFLWTAVFMQGREQASAPDVDPADATQKNTFNGGFLEVVWVPFADVAYNATPWAIFARWDVVRYETGPGDFDGASLGVRRHLALGPRASAAVHLEVHADRTRGTGFDPAGSEVQSQAALVGFDLAF